MEEQDYIKNRVDSQIVWFDTKSISNQKWQKTLKICELLFAVSIPLLLNYFTSLKHLNLIVSLISSAIVVVTGLFGIYKFEERWIQYRATCESLKREKYLFETASAYYAIKNPFPIFVERIENLLSKENDSWAASMAKRNKKASI